MDDDVYRRGKLSCYAKYGEALALLAGDGLLSLAFALLAKANLGDEATACLAQAAGPFGMIGGQAIDIAGTATDGRKLRTMHTRKTGALIQATIALGGCQPKLARISQLAWPLSVKTSDCSIKSPMTLTMQSGR